jgi:hypothetical protein
MIFGKLIFTFCKKKQNYKNIAETSVADPNPDPDPHVFGPPGSGSGSISQKYGSGSGSGSKSGSGSGSFYHQVKKVKKPWFLLLCDFFLTFYLCK